MSVVPRLEEQEMLEAFAPLHDWVVIRKWKPPEVTEHGIVTLEDTNNYQSKRGTVVKVGPCDKLGYPAPVKEGDDVLFGAFSGMEIPMPHGYLIMKVQDILVVLEEG